MCMAVSFVDRDMIMHYFGGGVGHLKNTPPQQAHRSDPVDPDSVEDEEDDTGGNTRGDPQDIIMSNGELEVGDDDEEKGRDDNDNETDNDNDDDDDDDDDDESNDEDEDKEDKESASGGDENKDEDYGYGSP